MALTLLFQATYTTTNANAAHTPAIVGVKLHTWTGTNMRQTAQAIRHRMWQDRMDDGWTDQPALHTLTQRQDTNAKHFPVQSARPGLGFRLARLSLELGLPSGPRSALHRRHSTQLGLVEPVADGHGLDAGLRKGAHLGLRDAANDGVPERCD